MLRPASSPSSAAKQILSTLRIEQPDELDIELIAAHFRASVLRRDVAGCDGRLLRAGDTALIVVDNRAYDSARWRFTIAHELGHLLLHKNVNVLKLCTERDMNEYHGSGRETEANRFAAELLMPKALFGPRCETRHPTLQTVRTLANEFATSLSATALRFVECTSEPCAVVYAENAQVKWWRKNEEFRLWIDGDSKLSSDSYAFDLAHGRRVDDRMQLTDALAWGDDSRAEDIDLYEHPMALPSLGGVLTLLWHPA